MHSEETVDAGHAVQVGYNYITYTICFTAQWSVILYEQYFHHVAYWWLGGLLVERQTSVSQILGSIPNQVAAV